MVLWMVRRVFFGCLHGLLVECVLVVEVFFNDSMKKVVKVRIIEFEI